MVRPSRVGISSGNLFCALPAVSLYPAQTDRTKKLSETNKVPSPLPSEAQNAMQIALETDQTPQLTTIVTMMMSKTTTVSALRMMVMTTLT